MQYFPQVILKFIGKSPKKLFFENSSIFLKFLAIFSSFSGIFPKIISRISQNVLKIK